MAETPVAPNNKSVQFGAKVGREPSGGKLRKNVKRALKRGLISEKAMKRHIPHA